VLEFRQSETLAWTIRLQIERHLRNITDAHVAIISHVAELADGGLTQVSHAAVAKALHRGARTVRDALRRARALGLLDWSPCYERRPGSLLSRRTANVYRRTMPSTLAMARPDVRRHPSRDGGTLRRASKEVRKQGLERDLEPLAAIATRREAQLGALWCLERTPQAQRLGP
jgi:hypothetical protein